MSRHPNVEGFNAADVAALTALADDATQLAAVADAYDAGARGIKVTSGTFGSDCTSFDLSGLAGDTLGPFEVVFRGTTATNTSGALSLRVNGGSADLDGVIITGVIPGGASGANVRNTGLMQAFTSLNGAGAAVGASWEVTISCSEPASSADVPQTIRARCVIENNPTTGSRESSVTEFTRNGTGPWNEITSVGVLSSVATNLASTSTWKLNRRVP
jgi:hypothetical protein